MFFKAGKVKILAEWHEKHLGVDFGGKVYTDFKFQDGREKGWFAFSFFEAETKYFEPSAKEFMIKPHAENLFELLKTPR